MPKFSIIIPVYNVAPYLRECLDSLLAQTFADWEAVCIDDGSNDGSGEILDEYAKKDLRFRVIHQKNAGVGVARNNGLDLAIGEYIVFVDGDDLLRSDTLEIISKMIQEYPYEKLFRFNYKSFLGGDVLSKDTYLQQEQRVVDISQKILYEDLITYFWQYVYEDTLIKELYFPRYIRGEDRIFLIEVLCNRANSFVATNAVCYYYRQRQGSAMNSVPSIQVLCDEMDHRLDVAEIIDRCGKNVSYSSTYWIEQYFTKTFPCIILGRPKDFDELYKMWKQRLLRARSLKGFSKSAKRFFFLHSNWLFQSFAYFYCFQISLFRQKSLICKLYRKLMNRGEYSKC